MDEKDYVPRSVRRADYAVIGTELIFNIFQALTCAAESIMEVAIYQANRETKISRAEDALSKDLEKLQEE